MLHTIWLILGIVNLLLILIATIVVVLNKRMTTAGRVIRILDILIFPVVGPITILIEVLSWKVEGEKAEKQRGGKTGHCRREKEGISSI